MRGISIKARIALAVTVFTVIVTAVVLTMTIDSVDKHNTQLTENSLYAAGENVCAQLEVDDGLVFADNSVFVDNAMYSAVYGKKGRFLCGYMPSASLDDVTAQVGQIQYCDSWIIYDGEYKLKGYGTVRIRCVTDIQDSMTLMSDLRMRALVGLLIIAFVSIVGCLLILRWSFRPMNKLMDTASNINSGTDLSRRVSLSGARGEFYTLGKTFNSMFDRLESSFKSEKRFTNDASHELRTPIAVILSETDYALEEHRSLEEQRESLAKIHKQALQMSGLTQQLLMISRSERGALNLKHERVNLSELVNMAADVGEDLARGKSIAVHCAAEPDIMIMGDESMLMRLVLNLVENAVRYGNEGGNIDISLVSSCGKAVVTVKDDGIGISQEDLPHIWERLYQADTSRTGVDSGSGLGLSLVKIIAEAHGGSVSCSSVLHEGSVFVFELPLEGARSTDKPELPAH